MNVDQTEGRLPIVLTPLDFSPSRESVTKWLQNRKMSNSFTDIAVTSSGKKGKRKNERTESQQKDRSQLEAPSMNNSFGFRVSFGNCLEAKAVHQVINCLCRIYKFITLNYCSKLVLSSINI